MTVRLLTIAMVAQGPVLLHSKDEIVSSGNGHVMLECYIYVFLLFLQRLLWLLICSLAVYYPGKSILDDGRLTASSPCYIWQKIIDKIDVHR